MEKKLKIGLIILVIVLIVVVGFGGVYIKKLVSYNNIIPDYEMGLKLKGSRITALKVADHTHEVIYDSEGNVVDEIPEGADENDYRTEQVPENNEEDKTQENYKKVKEIIKGRLEALAVSNYEVRLNEESGNILVELADTDNTDTILASLLESGEFEIIDTDDKTVLMTNDDVESASVVYNSDTTGISVYLNIKFNGEGKKKLRQISKDYIEIEETEATEEGQEEVKQKTITMNINGEEFLSTHFHEEVTELNVTIGSASTDSDTISEYIRDAQYYSALLSNEPMPLEYEVETSDYIQSIYAINPICVYILLGLIALLVLASIVYMIAKYKKMGLLSSIVYIGTVALVLILIRVTRTEITLDILVSSIILVLINTYINCKVLNNLNKQDSVEDRKMKIYNAYQKVVDLLIIILIPSVVFTYNASSTISSIGMLLFWGIISIAIMNVLFTRILLLEEAKK